MSRPCTAPHGICGAVAPSARFVNVDPLCRVVPPADRPESLLHLADTGLDLLLDGNKRCRFWYRNADTGLHDAYVLLVRDLNSR